MLSSLPESIVINGRCFKRSIGLKRPGVIGHYREDVKIRSRHAFIMNDGKIVIDHIDRFNPDYGLIIEHFLFDVLPYLTR